MIFRNTIINFHKTSNAAWFAKVLSLLKRYYTIIPIQKLEKYYYNGERIKNSCHITIDDGDRSFYTHIFPVIKKLKIPVSLYVSPSILKNNTNFWFQEIKGYDEDLLKKIISQNTNIDKHSIKTLTSKALLKTLQVNHIHRIIDLYQKKTSTIPKPPQNMNIDQLMDVHKSGLVEIGAHTQNHPILKNETYQNATKEIKDSIYQLSDMLNMKIKWFAYPHGSPGLDFDDREIRIVEDCGIKLAFSTNLNFFSKNDNPLLIPRSGFTYGNRLFVTTKLLLGAYWKLLRNF